MKIFIDSADPKEIKKAWDTGMINGVTTNPTLATQAGVDFKDAVKEILEIVDGPVSLEVISTDYDGMVREGRELAKIHDNVVVKIPMLPEGLRAVKTLKEEGIKTNVTLVFSPGQALLIGKTGSDYVSPFIGRMDDLTHVGMDLVGEMRQMYDNYGFETQILVASDRTPRDTVDAALIGADVITTKYSNFEKLFKHPLTDLGLKKFLDDWKESGQSSLV
ncbi:MAG TPA: fructose-6-phosphate aldolase [Candidatus Dojkabacteria bacterium]|jgi:transaldolase